MYKDARLERYIDKVKESKKTSAKVENYKKAVKRLDDLKVEYNKLEEVLKKSKKKEVADIETIGGELTRILDSINAQGQGDGDNIDMLKLVTEYVEYKNLLVDLDGEYDKIKNEIYEVKKDRKGIVVGRINFDEML